MPLVLDLLGVHQTTAQARGETATAHLPWGFCLMSTPAPPAGPHLSSMPFVIYPHHTPLVLVSLSPIPSWPFRTGSLSPSPRCTITSTGSRPTLLREQVGVHLNFNSTSLAALWEIDLREQSGREITWEATAPTQARDDCSLGTEGTMVMD